MVFVVLLSESLAKKFVIINNLFEKFEIIIILNYICILLK